MAISLIKNKRCMMKVGAIKVSIALTLAAIMTLFLIILTSATPETYEVGEKVKIEIGEVGDYKMTIETPDQTYVYKSNKSYFIFKPTIQGEHQIKIRSDEGLQEFSFTAVEVSKNISEEKIEESKSEDEEPQEINKTKDVEEELERAKKIVVGEPVLWEEKLSRETTGQITIPFEAENI